MIAINMPMPETCYNCRFRSHKPFSSLEHRCVAAMHRIIMGDKITGKPDWCPLVQVRSEKHGTD